MIDYNFIKVSTLL